MRFLSKMLSASAITIEGMKMIFSPASHFSKTPEAFGLIFGLSVNHQSRACVSATKFISILYFCAAIKRFFCRGDFLLGNINLYETTYNLSHATPQSSQR